jgi:ketosteroid isomerase-like protein
MMPDEPTTPDVEEIVKRGAEAGSRGDIDGSTAPFSSDAVWDLSSVGMGTFSGHEEIRAFFEDWTGAYEDFAIALEQFHDLGNGVTLAVYVQHGRPSGSDGFVEFRYAAVSAWADGLIAWQTHYTDIDEARTAAERLAEERR